MTTIYTLKEMQAKSAEALKNQFEIIRYMNAENDERLIKIFQKDLNEEKINYKYWHWLIRNYIKSLNS